MHRSTPSLGRAALALFAVGAITLAACSPPPRGTATDASRPRSESVAVAERDTTVTRSAYDFEREGTFPAPSPDVEFEEDALPPRPEEVQSAPLSGTGVRAADVPEPTEAEEPGAEAPDAGAVREPTVDPAPSVTTPVPSQPKSMRMGFRVQLIAAADRVEAEQFAREARTRLAAPVYVEFEAPYYKVRAGDFVDRADALVLRDRARAVGYEGAWVTTARVVDSATSGS